MEKGLTIGIRIVHITLRYVFSADLHDTGSIDPHRRPFLIDDANLTVREGASNRSEFSGIWVFWRYFDNLATGNQYASIDDASSKRGTDLTGSCDDRGFR